MNVTTTPLTSRTGPHRIQSKEGRQLVRGCCVEDIEEEYKQA